MLKDILLKTAELINRDDLIEGLNKELSDNPQTIQNDIIRLISYYNHTIETLCENYFNLTHSQEIYSNNRKISFLSFDYEPTKIISVLKNKQPVYFSTYSKYILVSDDNCKFEIIYKYLPERVLNLSDNTKLPKGVTEKIVCYGIASEFLACKNQLNQAEYWNNKFIFEIFKSKTSRDRKLKQTFVI